MPRSIFSHDNISKPVSCERADLQTRKFKEMKRARAPCREWRGARAQCSAQLGLLFPVGRVEWSALSEVIELVRIAIFGIMEF